MEYFSLLRHIDLFPRTVNLRYKESDVFKTVIGGIFSILMVLVLLSFVTIKITEVLEGKIENLSYSTVPTRLEKFDFRFSRDLVIAFAFEDKNIDSTVYNLQLGYRGLSQNENLQENLKVYNCTQDVYLNTHKSHNY